MISATNTRQNQDLDRIKAHRAQRINFLAHPHRAELGRVGAAGPAGDHDADDQHAYFAQHQHTDHVDDVDVRPKLAEMENALLRENGADQYGDQQDDRHRPPANALELVDHRRETKACRPQHHALERDDQRADHLRQHDKIAPTDVIVMPTLSSVAMMLLRLGGGGDSACVPA